MHNSDELLRLQTEVGTWVEHNFGETLLPIEDFHYTYQPLLGIVEEAGEFDKALFKEVVDRAEVEDAIGDTLIYIADYCNCMDIKLCDLSVNVYSTRELFHVVSDLCHEHLKYEQGIRGENSIHLDKIKNLITELILNLEEFYEYTYKESSEEFLKMVMKVWEKVKCRDWKRDKDTGGEVE
jgi:NTP pyrophosphatase (non-canonical NTP hydrolase)